jgi:hypothetical protein
MSGEKVVVHYGELNTCSASGALDCVVDPVSMETEMLQVELEYSQCCSTWWTSSLLRCGRAWCARGGVLVMIVVGTLYQKVSFDEWVLQLQEAG